MTLSSAQSWITAPLRMLSGNCSRRDDALSVRPARPIDPLKLLRRSMRSKLGTHLRKTESHENRLISNRGHAHEGRRLAARLRGQSRPHSNRAGWTSRFDDYSVECCAHDPYSYRAPFCARLLRRLIPIGIYDSPHRTCVGDRLNDPLWPSRSCSKPRTTNSPLAARMAAVAIRGCTLQGLDLAKAEISAKQSSHGGAPGCPRLPLPPRARRSMP